MLLAVSAVVVDTLLRILSLVLSASTVKKSRWSTNGLEKYGGGLGQRNRVLRGVCA
jgi:hypothetical protein